MAVAAPLPDANWVGADLASEQDATIFSFPGGKPPEGPPPGSETIRQAGIIEKIGRKAVSLFPEEVRVPALRVIDIIQDPDLNDIELSDLVFDNQVAEFKNLREERNSHGYVWVDMVRMTDGVPYVVVTGEPLKRKTDVQLNEGAAWFTSDRGHNMRNLFNGLDLGYPTAFVSHRGEYRDSAFSRKEKNEQAQSISLDILAHDQVEILLGIAKMHGRDTSKMALRGESEQAMVMMGIMAMAEIYGYEVVYAEALDPCFPTPLSASEIRKHPRQIADEFFALGQVGARFTLAHLLQYPATINPSGNSLRHNIASAPALIDGLTGKMARLIPPHQNMTLWTLDKNPHGQGEEWEKIFHTYDGVRIRHEDVAHLGLAVHHVREAASAHLEALALELERTNDDTSQIDFSAVHLADAA